MKNLLAPVVPWRHPDRGPQMGPSHGAPAWSPAGGPSSFPRHRSSGRGDVDVSFSAKMHGKCMKMVISWNLLLVVDS